MRKADPARAAERAVNARVHERAGTTPFEEALDAEIAAMREHSQDASHRIALREQEVREFERTHDPGGERIYDYGQSSRTPAPFGQALDEELERLSGRD